MEPLDFKGWASRWIASEAMAVVGARGMIGHI